MTEANIVVPTEFSTLRCACGSTDLISIAPGQEPQRRGAVDLFTRVDPLVDIGAPTVARCRACFTKAFPALNRMEEMET